MNISYIGDMRITLSNGLEMPRCIQGLPLIMGKEKITYKDFSSTCSFCAGNGTAA